MAQAEIHEVLPVEMKRLYDVIVRYEDYPEFLEGCASVKVDRRSSELARVSYEVSMMKVVNYTLDHKENSKTRTVEWSLVDSDFFKKNTGSWILKPAGKGKTDVIYRLDVEFKIPVPGFIVSRLVKGNLPSMIKSFEKRAKAKS